MDVVALDSAEVHGVDGVSSLRKGFGAFHMDAVSVQWEVASRQLQVLREYHWSREPLLRPPGAYRQEPFQARSGREEVDLRCSICAMPFSHRKIYGIVCAGKWTGSKPDDGKPLALFCESCVESRKIRLVRTI
jgi:hypothetical protein